MLQFILCENDRYSVGELAQMAVEGGCLWITLHPWDAPDSEIRDAVSPDVVDLCREASVFLTVDDRPELARELGLHGIRLSRKFFIDNPSADIVGMREELGPEAVIGVELGDTSSLPALAAADVDFVTIPAGMPREERIALVERVKKSGYQLPVVAEGNFTIDEALEAVADGCAGVALGRPIADAHDPVATMQEYIDTLTAMR